MSILSTPPRNGRSMPLRIDKECQRRGTVIKENHGINTGFDGCGLEMPNAEAAKKIYHVNPSVKADLNTFKSLFIKGNMA